jgi:hypothetical protein
VAFAFTSLYQRVTKLSEFRFWGGSGNTARFNVPFVFNEANVFLTFERKARAIADHLATTASGYRGSAIVVNGSATDLSWLPDESIDLVFTDPPFGANINYSEMNILWESWLQAFTDAADEAVVNRVQGKDVDAYRELMAQCLREAFRVLRPGHWLLLVFMNSSSRIWAALQSAIAAAGFEIRRVDSFDKQHGTFKHFVSGNTAGEDLVLHCLKPAAAASADLEGPVSIADAAASIDRFLDQTACEAPTTVYLHVERDTALDVRKLYSDWMARAIVEGVPPVDFARFRAHVDRRADGRQA